MKLVFKENLKSCSHPIIITITMLLMTLNSHAQDYENAIKLQTLSGFGISYKYLTGFENGIEVSYNINKDYNKLTLLRVFQEPAIPHLSNKLFATYGYGAHITWYDQYRIRNPFTPFNKGVKVTKDFFSPGFDGQIGLEYRILKIPLVIFTELNGSFGFFGPDYFRADLHITGGVGYVF
ncbi:hypothetical protein ACT3CD_14375 [Geofilum sp. OHC36d9]|uniref:hypothetical protein n=1 Tax=Geofilum sp. OHC36d9 TaxID=3458413 RepID=UPI004033D484